MLNKELLSTIEGLNEDQISKIVELSQNDENAVIASKLREVHDGYDNDIFNVTGLRKETSEKSYDFLKRVLTDFKSKSEVPNDLQKEIKSLKQKNDELSKSVKSGSNDESLKKALSDKETLISKLRGDLKNKESEYNEMLNAKDGELNNFKLSSIQDLANLGLKYKAEIDSNTLKYHQQGARNEAMSIGTPEIAEVDGRNAIIFRDADGNIITDDNNLRKPMTFESKYKQLLQPILDVDSNVSGLGGKNINGKPVIGGGEWSTKVEATRAIAKELTANGYKAGTSEYDNKLSELYKEYNVQELPIR